MSDKLRKIVVFFCFLTLTASICHTQPTSVLKKIYARQAFSLLESRDSIGIAGFVPKGSAMLLIEPSFKFLTDSSAVDYYKVRTGYGVIGYVSSDYITFDKEIAASRYKAEIYDSLHSKAKDNFHGGDPLGCDYFPMEKPSFEDNVMPRACYSLYLTCSDAILKNIDAYISFAKTTLINTFVIDIKEDGFPGFKADAMKRYVPSAYARAHDNEALYGKVVKKLHDEGFWVVGRIVTFKDYHLTKDHPECSLWDNEKGAMLYHNKSHWPSAYSRFVWEYNVALACEAVRKFGFDEINFDYVRFPDRMTSIEDKIEMRNKYHESKIQAIQRFVTYAAEMLHREHAYISIDVFGECANPGYTTAYGQYWPAISNVADVISGMPYPDHFTNGYYGISQPWNHPYEILHAWGKRAAARQEETPSPAIVRTWVQAYHVMKHVDPNGIDYNAANIEKEIRGLYDAGLTGGYVTWLSSSSLDRYKSQAEAFRKDYYNEWKSNPK